VRLRTEGMRSGAKSCARLGVDSVAVFKFWLRLKHIPGKNAGVAIFKFGELKFYLVWFTFLGVIPF
jgi:hypothetical protein